MVDGFREHLRDLGILSAEASDCVPKPPSVADEICGLIEWPVVLRGRIDREFMDLPVDIRRSVMNGHQKYLEATMGSSTFRGLFLSLKIGCSGIG